MNLYYDKEGKPIELMKWVELFGDFKYKSIQNTILKNGTRVSTVWLGLDHSFAVSRQPLIFETMVFPGQT